MYTNVVIEPEWDESFHRSGAPTLPSLIVTGLGFVDDNGQPVDIFRGATEEEAWRAAFDASAWGDLDAFRENTSLNGHHAHAWSAVCPGRTAPARWFYLVIPSEQLRTRIEAVREL